MQNTSPVIYPQLKARKYTTDDTEIDEREIFDHIRHILDPEYPLSLEQLNVVQLSNVTLKNRTVLIEFIPTIKHCSMAIMIGLSIKVKLQFCLPSYYKVDVKVKPGFHNTEDSVNKQLQDKERVCAACENPVLMKALKSSIFAYEVKKYSRNEYSTKFQLLVDSAKPHDKDFRVLMSGLLHGSKRIYDEDEDDNEDSDPEINEKLQTTCIEERGVV